MRKLAGNVDGDGGMTTLTQCRWREADGGGLLVRCTSAKLRCSRAFNASEVCPMCPFPDHEPPPPPAPMSRCIHLGLELRQVTCEPCKGKPRIKVFACEVFGQCTIGKPVDGVSGCCNGKPAANGRPGPPCISFTPTPSMVVVPQPSPLDLQPRSPRAVVTIAVGEEGRGLLAVSEPYMRAYARRVGADFVPLDWPGHPQWPMSAKFGIPRVLDHYARIAYVDADVLLRHGCVNLFDLCDSDEFGVVDEFPFHLSKPQHQREQKYQSFRRLMGFRRIPHVPWYFNAGVMVVPRQHRSLLLPPDGPIPAEHCSEQDHTNSRVLDGYMAGDVKVRLMDRRANWQNWTDYGFKHAPPDAVLHLSGGGRERVHRVETMAAIAAAHPIPEPTPTVILEEPVMPAHIEAGWCIDLRHLRWLHAVLMSGRFRRVLEIGSYHGYSTTAFLAALEAGKVGEVHLCEPHPTAELLERIAGTGAVLHAERSVDLLAADADWDFVFVDGDHFEANVKEEARLLIAAGVRCVMAHDTSAASIYPECDGPQHLKAAFQAAGYFCCEDSLKREGERTERGMFFAALDRSVYQSLILA